MKSPREEKEVWFDGLWSLHHGYLWFSLSHPFTHPAVPVLEWGVGVLCHISCRAVGPQVIVWSDLVSANRQFTKEFWLVTSVRTIPQGPGTCPVFPCLSTAEPMSLGGLDRVYNLPGSSKLLIHFINSSI